MLLQQQENTNSDRIKELFDKEGKNKWAREKKYRLSLPGEVKVHVVSKHKYQVLEEQITRIM